jgi:hypothetical protein
MPKARSITRGEPVDGDHERDERLSPAHRSARRRHSERRRKKWSNRGTVGRSIAMGSAVHHPLLDERRPSKGDAVAGCPHRRRRHADGRLRGLVAAATTRCGTLRRFCW